MTYDNARDSILSGSLVFFKAETFKQKIVTFFTGGKYSHCGIAVWMTCSCTERRLMLVESFVGGCRIVNLRSYSNRPMSVLNVGMDWQDIEEYVIAKTGKVQYGGLDFSAIGVKDVLTRLKLKSLAKYIKNSSGEVCSEMVADVMLKSSANERFKITDSLVSPSGLYEFIAKRKLFKSSISVE